MKKRANSAARSTCLKATSNDRTTVSPARRPVMQSPWYVVVTNPGGKRWQLYGWELTAFWHGRGVEPEVEVVPWAEVVSRDGNLDGLAAFDRPAVVRIESPGRDFEVTKL